MKIAIIGCGVMGSALAKHLKREHTLILCDSDKKRAGSLAKEVGGTVLERLNEAVQESEAIILAVKPKDLAHVAKLTASSFSKKQLLISILAGTSVSLLRQHFPEVTILRIMPNLALTCGQGVIGLVDDPHLSQEIKTRGEYLLNGLGLMAWLPEKKLEALSALAGSGPAFIFVLIEALIEGGIYLGFAPSEAQEFVLKTMEGAIALLRETGKHPAKLKWEVASPAGTTIAGLREMEIMQVRAGLINTLIATYQRGLRLQEDIDP